MVLSDFIVHTKREQFFRRNTFKAGGPSINSYWKNMVGHMIKEMGRMHVSTIDSQNQS